MTMYKAVQVDVGKSHGSVQTGNFLSPAALLCCVPDNFGSPFPNHFYILHIPLGLEGVGEQEYLQCWTGEGYQLDLSAGHPDPHEC